MKSTKKLIALVLSVLMMMSMMLCANATTFSDVDETHNRYTAITTLADMGIINGYTDGTFKPDSPVTRAEMAKMVALVFNYGLNSATESPYTDVEKDHWAINYIATMRDVGVINGFPDGTFLPNGEVTYEQAIKMIICALNWGEVAQQQTVEGDWSSGYRAMAQRLGVAKLVYPKSNAEPASRSTIAQLLYNSLDVKPAEKYVDSKGNISYKESDKTLNESTSQSVSYTNAQIITTPDMNIDPSNSSIANGNIRVRVGTDVYTINVGTNTKVYDYIGRYGDIRFSIDSNGDYSLISFLPKGDDTTLDIKSIKNVTSTTIEYYTDDEYEKTNKITLTNPTVIYNNRALTTSDLSSLFGTIMDANALNYFGTVKVTENNVGTLVVINAYKSYEFESYNSTSFDVTLKGLNGSTYTVNMPAKDQATKGYVIVKKSSLTDKGSVSTSLSISKGAVVTISESAKGKSVGDNYIEYIVNSSTSTITPTNWEQINNNRCSAKGSDGSKEIYVANKEAAANFGVGMTTTYYTDASGDAVLVKTSIDKSNRVGLFMSGEKNKSDDTTTVTFYDPTDSSTFTVKVEDDGDVNKIVAGKNAGSLFWMNITNNKVKSGKIEAMIDGGNYTSVSDVKFITEKTVKKSGTSYTFGSTNYSSNSYAIKAVKRPDDLATASSFNYSTFSFTDNIAYNADAVTFKQDSKTYVVMLVSAYKGLLDSSPVYVVKKIGSTTNNGETQIQTVECYNFKNGSDASVKFEVSTLNSISLEMGDIFTYYSDCDTDGVDIDKTETVKVIVKANKLAANKALANILTDRLTKAGTSVNGYKKYGVYRDDLTNDYYNYILTTPVHFANDDNKAVLYMAKDGKNSMLSNDFGTMLDGCVGSDWTWDNVSSALGSKVIDKDLLTYKNIFVFDKDGATEDEKFYKLTDANYDSISSVFGEVKTVFDGTAPADASELANKIANSSLVFAYFTEDGAIPLNALYIIK